MSQFIHTFLASEITCLPQALDRYAGKYYSNKISNGATWVFLMWHVIHFAFEESINLLMKKMRIKEYVRIRLKQSIWYLGFYTMSFVYCTATLYKNNIDVFSHRKLLTVESEIVPGYLILGFIVLSTFYAHSIVWEGLKKGFSVCSFSYMFLTAFILLTYMTRKVELSLSLLAIISFTQFGIELARCSYTLLQSDAPFIQLVLKSLLGLSITLFVLTHLIIIPLFFLFPLMYRFFWEAQSNSVMLFNVTLWLWLTCEICNNPLYKVCKHWIEHNPQTSRTVCPGCLVECSLFHLRDDDAYNMQIIRQEIKDREANTCKEIHQDCHSGQRPTFSRKHLSCKLTGADLRVEANIFETIYSIGNIEELHKYNVPKNNHNIENITKVLEHQSLTKYWVSFFAGQMIALRKPKNRNMLLQTLKCMVAIKRKLKEKRASESSDSDESEYSESEQRSKDRVSDSGSEDDISELDDDTASLVKKTIVLDNKINISQCDAGVGQECADQSTQCDSKININPM